MNLFENHAGLTITSTKLQLVEVKHLQGQYVLSNVDEVFFSEPANFEQDQETKILPLLQSAYNELSQKLKLKISNVSFTLPHSVFQVIQVPYDNTLLNQDLIEQFRWEFSVLYPYLKTNDFVIQYLEIDKNPLNGNSTAIVIGLDRKYLQLLFSFSDQNNLKLRFVDNAHIASDRALFLTNNLTDKGVTLSVLFSDNFLSVIFSFNGKPVYFKIIPLKNATEVVPALSREINQNSILKVEKELIKSAFITGDEVTSSLTESINKSLGVSFNYFNPFSKIIPAEELFSNKYFLDKNNSFTPAAGIAFRLS